MVKYREVFDKFCVPNYQRGIKIIDMNKNAIRFHMLLKHPDGNKHFIRVPERKFLKVVK